MKGTAGLTYCAITALYFLDKIPNNVARAESEGSPDRIAFDECVRCILSRQSTYFEDDEDEDESDNISSITHAPDDNSAPPSQVGYMPHIGLLPIDELPRRPLTIISESVDVRYIGFNGRPNKIVDTCYSWWNMAALAVRSFKFRPVDGHADLAHSSSTDLNLSIQSGGDDTCSD